MTKGHIPASLSRRVRRRAADRCEYCHLPQDSQEATFHIDHIKPLSAGGPTDADNLALACVTCSLRKAARQKPVIRVTNDWSACFTLAKTAGQIISSGHEHGVFEEKRQQVARRRPH